MKRRVANDLRRLRFAAHEMTQAELGAAVGVTRQTINAIERGKYAPSLDIAFLIAETLGAPVDQVFWLEREE